MSFAGVRKCYGSQTVLDDVSLTLERGEVHAIMGENGAGKSTLARIAAGIAAPDAGTIRMDEVDVRFADPRQAQARGVAMITQELDLFPHLSVGENIVIGNLAFPEGRRVSQAAIAAFCIPFLQRVGLDIAHTTLLARMPIGQWQLVAIARALSMKCGILIMDEPTSALSDDAAERMFEVIRRLREDGVAIAYVSHKMDEIFAHCDRVTVLRDGRCIDTRAIGSVSRSEMIRMMVGRPMESGGRRVLQSAGPARIEFRGVTTAKLRDVSFEVRAGEVVGIAGLVGAGRSELGAALVGLDRMLGGEMLVDGQALRPRGPDDARKRGIALLPEDRKLQGLMLSMSLRENASLSVVRRLGRFGFINRRSERKRVEPPLRNLSVRCTSINAAIGTLSGGNQQKGLLARLLLTDPDILFLDDPTRGVDVGAKEDIYAMIDGLAASGKAVLLASSELPELLRCADRIIVLADGRITACFDAAEATQEAIMDAATQFTSKAA